MGKNIQRVTIVTEDGNAINDEHLKRLWEERLWKISPHYTVEKVEIVRKQTSEKI